MISAEHAFQSYSPYCPNIFIPEVLEVIQEADTLVTDAPRDPNRPLLMQAVHWLRLYRATVRGRLALEPWLVRAALARAVLDLAENLLQTRGIPYSACEPSFIFTGRVADQVGIARRTVQEHFAAAKVARVLHPEDGEAWVLRDAERALSEAGWVWMEDGSAKRNPRSGNVRPIRLHGGRLYGSSPVPRVEPRNPLAEACIRAALREPEVRGLRTTTREILVLPTLKAIEVQGTYLRTIQDLVAEGVICPRHSGTDRDFLRSLLQREGRKTLRRRVLALDWQARLVSNNRPSLLENDDSQPIFVSRAQNESLKRRRLVSPFCGDPHLGEQV